MEQEYKEKIEELIGRMKCQKDFICYQSGFEYLCKAKQTHGTVSSLECLARNPQACVFSTFVSDQDIYFCTCPLRIYIAENLNM